jgi:hypothetical protein
MSEFTIHTSGTAPDASKDVLRTLEQNIGFVPNLAATIAGSPAALQSFVAMQSALRGVSTLTPLEREVVGIYGQLRQSVAVLDGRALHLCRGRRCRS